MCTDYSNHIYILEDGGLSKYNSNGIFISQAAFAGQLRLTISNLDFITIVLTGVYYGSFTLGNFPVFADGNGANTYCAKISSVGSALAESHRTWEYYGTILLQNDGWMK